jgi:8-oxo-dGTP pyrophosphatase MutT (NUDIX family)
MISFSEQLRSRLSVNLAAHVRREHELLGRRHAAVAVVLVDGDAREGAAFLLCQRAMRMNRHAGQWALPGGRVDDGETAVEAALRELDEELGVRLPADRLVGFLDDYPTRSGYVITPVVVWGEPDLELTPSPDEVLAVHRVGVQALVDATPRFMSIPESDRPVLQIPLAGDLLHAPTAAILFQFREVGWFGRTGERVDHLEQPVFAWR